MNDWARPRINRHCQCSGEVGNFTPNSPQRMHSSRPGESSKGMSSRAMLGKCLAVSFAQTQSTSTDGCCSLSDDWIIDNILR